MKGSDRPRGLNSPRDAIRRENTSRSPRMSPRGKDVGFEEEKKQNIGHAATFSNKSGTPGLQPDENTECFNSELLA